MKNLKLRMFIPTVGMLYRDIYDKNWYFHPKETKLYREIKQSDHVFPLMISTGLKDKNGKEIYEGDVIQNYHKDYSTNELIKFEETDIFPSEFTESCGCCNIIYGWNIGYKAESCEIIGNIHENPDLISLP